METIDIHSRMSHFRLLSKVLAVSSRHLEAEAVFGNAPCFAGLELMAQTAALHVRRRLDFDRHAFLLSVRQCTIPPIDFLKGRYRATAILRQQSSEAFMYHVAACGHDGIDLDGDLLIGTRAFDDHFPKEVLGVHYQQLWNQMVEG